MSKRTGPTKVKLSDFKDKKEKEGAVDIETDDGQEFRVPPPELWPDDTTRLLTEENLIGAGASIMGPEQFEKFCAAGGSAGLMLAIVKETHGIDVPES